MPIHKVLIVDDSKTEIMFLKDHHMHQQEPGDGSCMGHASRREGLHHQAG